MDIVPETSDEKNTDSLKEYQDQTIELKDGRYYAKLPWKQEHAALRSNYDITLKRTESIISRLQRQSEVPKRSDEIIREQERKGFTELVPAEKELPSQVHEIPYHPVKKDSSTTPVRIVYDCSCRQSPN